MRVAELVEAETFKLRNDIRPSPGPSEVLVKVSEVGICGSDIHWYTHGQMGERTVDEPLVLGHESAGTVVETGSNVDKHDIGDEVTIEPGIPCGGCEFCRSGQYNLCPDVSFMATPGTDGAFREYIAWPAEYVYSLPPSVSTREGALCEPISVGIHAVRRANIDFGDTVLIMGAGPIGILAADVARAAGAAEIIVVDIVNSKLDRAVSRGADLTINSRDEDVSAAVRDEFGSGVDVFIEATGVPSAIETGIKPLRPGGTAILVGLAPNADVAMDTFELVRRQIDVRGSYRFENTYPEAISLITGDKVNADGIIDFEMTLDQISDAFEQATKPEMIKGLISIN